MSMEKEALTNTIESDLAKRNRTWDKVETHFAESTKKHIYSSGTQNGGWYINFDDGTQIAYKKHTVDTTSNTAYGNMFRSPGLVVAPPIGFLNDEYSMDISSLGAGSDVSFWIGYQGELKNYINVFTAISVSSMVLNLAVLYVGRWK